MEKIKNAFGEYLNQPPSKEEEVMFQTEDEKFIYFRAGALAGQRELIEELREQFGKMYDYNENGVEYMQTFPINQILDEVMNILTTIEKEVE